MKLTPALSARVHETARTLAATAATPTEVAEAAHALAVDVVVLEGAMERARVALGGGARDVVPHAAKQGAARASDVRMTQLTRAQRRWDPCAHLSPALQARLSAGDQRNIDVAVAALQDAVERARLSFVPVFGYLSLRTNNHRELGKAAQSDVQPSDVLAAALPDYDVGVLASSVVYGTPQHPGAGAGLSRKEGASTPGVVLKVPLERAEELLAVLLAREMFAEGDMKDGVGKDGAPVSNAMYAPAVLPVHVKRAHVDGALDHSLPSAIASSDDTTTLPALVFITNEAGAKALGSRTFGDDEGLTLERLAYLFAGQGGMVRAGAEGAPGVKHGGPTVDYWQKSYLDARAASGQAADPTIATAVELSRLMPSPAVLDRILARTDDDGRLMQAALRLLFSGAATPLLIHANQKDVLEGIERERLGTRGEDAEARLLAKAKELCAAGLLD